MKFGANPSTIFLVIVVIDRHTHTDRQTNAGENIFPHFCRDKDIKTTNNAFRQKYMKCATTRDYT